LNALNKIKNSPEYKDRVNESNEPSNTSIEIEERKLFVPNKVYTKSSARKSSAVKNYKKTDRGSNFEEDEDY